jgi:hypothetical protein
MAELAPLLLLRALTSPWWKGHSEDKVRGWKVKFVNICKRPLGGIPERIFLYEEADVVLNV